MAWLEIQLFLGDGRQAEKEVRERQTCLHRKRGSSCGSGEAPELAEHAGGTPTPRGGRATMDFVDEIEGENRRGGPGLLAWKKRGGGGR